ncbi:thiamine monophosphate synthase [Senna tora]|uniref:Uncharacterized protein ycf23 n=1 Tax=Senna tora TaxID=362788 RepID=A0A834SH18_9FABA|nr:thiamine monophosphate synthase [Senna tora]
MHSISCIPISSSSHTFLNPNHNPLLPHSVSPPQSLSFTRRRTNFTTKALLSSTKESVLRDFYQRRALKVRNSCKFEQKSLSFDGVWLKVDRWYEEFLHARGVVSSGGGTIGALFQDSNGCCLGAFAQRLNFPHELAFLEAFAVKRGVELALMMGFDNLEVEGDALLGVLFRWVARESNTSAHALARYARDLLEGVVWTDAIPLFLSDIITGLQNYNKDNIASVVIAAEKGGATHVDIACDPELVTLAISLTSCPVCVSSVDPATFPAAVEAGAQMVEIGNYDSFYEKGIIFTPEQILGLTKETKRILPSIVLSVTVPHTLSLPDQVKLAEALEQEGVDIIQTEGGKCSSPSKSGVLGLIEKATPTLAAAYSISRAVRIPVMCSSGLSSVTAPMAITAGASGVGVGSAVNKLNDVIAMIAEVRSIADSLHTPFQSNVTVEAQTQRL